MSKKTKNQSKRKAVAIPDRVKPLAPSSKAPRSLWMKIGIASLFAIISFVAFFGIPGLQPSQNRSSTQGISSNLLNGMAESCAYAAECDPTDTLIKVLNSAAEIPGLKGKAESITNFAAASAKYSHSIDEAAGSLKSGKGLFGAAPAVEKSALNEAQLSNLTRFEKKLPAGAQPSSLHSARNGVAFKAEVPGEVPGSKAIYEKVVDSTGETVAYTKTSYTPSGEIVHIKGKMKKGSAILVEEDL